jgi:NADH-quinone oxidoreductase subunit H
MLLNIGIPFVLLLLLSVAYNTLSDRKFMAASQRRKGPNVVGPKGILQPLTDGGKLFGKQVIILKNSNLILFQLAPILIFSISLFLWTLLPFFSTIHFGSIINLQQLVYSGNKNILFILLIMSFSTAAFLSAGWASSSKYAVLGGIRGANQVLGYELNLTFVIIILILFLRSFSLENLMLYQAETYNFFFHIELLLIFWISILAECGRVPFDLPESESELVAGYFTEYSGFLFALFFLAEYSNMIFNSFLSVVFFFGGWVTSPFNSELYFSVNYFKLFFGIFFFLLMFSLHRSVLARLRIDQLYYLNWKFFMPILGFEFFLFIFLLFILMFNKVENLTSSVNLIVDYIFSKEEETYFRKIKINSVYELISNTSSYGNDGRMFKFLIENGLLEKHTKLHVNNLEVSIDCSSLSDNELYWGRRLAVAKSVFLPTLHASVCALAPLIVYIHFFLKPLF